MDIAVLSNTRRPTLPDSPWGLGNSMWTLAHWLGWNKHAVTLFAGPGSEFKAGRLVTHQHENDRYFRPDQYDAWLDGGHEHSLSKANPDWPVVNRIGDRECPYTPPNAVVESEYMQDLYPTAKLVRKGFDRGRYPFTKRPENYVAFYGSIVMHKGPQMAVEVAMAAHRTIRFAGPLMSPMHVPHYQGVLAGKERWQFLGGAKVLLHPSFNDAAPRAIVEAALCGTPTLCFDCDGAQEFVEHGVTGFVCRDFEDMVDRLPDAELLDRRQIRYWAEGQFPIEDWVGAYEELLYQVADGERW